MAKLTEEQKEKRRLARAAEREEQKRNEARLFAFANSGPGDYFSMKGVLQSTRG